MFSIRIFFRKLIPRKEVHSIAPGETQATTRKKHQTYRNTERLCPRNYRRPCVCLKRACALSLFLFFFTCDCV